MSSQSISGIRWCENCQLYYSNDLPTECPHDTHEVLADLRRQLAEMRERATIYKTEREHPVVRVLYLLGNGDISVGKACEFMREYLLTGVQGPLVEGSVDDLAEEWFPCGKWATVQHIEALVSECVRATIEHAKGEQDA
jgi:hypothetical protein